MADVMKDMRQSYVIMKNEIKKFFSGKRMTLFLGLLGVILFVLTVVPYLLGKELSDDPKEIIVPYLSLVSLIVLMSSTLFASICIVSEYEERTALIVFTRPIRKSSIFLGKMLACLVVSWGFILFYYVVAALVSLIIAHGLEPDLFASMMMAFVYAFATIGIAMLVSSIMKKSNTSTIMTFVILLVILPAFSLVLGTAGFEVDWMIDKVAESITNCSEGYRETMNEMLSSIEQMLSSPESFLTEGWQADLIAAGQDPLIVLTVLANHWAMGSGFMGEAMISAPDLLHDSLIMVAWGVVGLVAAFFKFMRREF